jgi:hypothetical protein
MRAARRVEPPVVFTVRDLTDTFDVHEQTIRRWARGGVPVGHKAGPRNHKLWFLSSDVSSFMRTARGSGHMVRGYWYRSR